jgi:hypothetical protein
MHKRYTSEDGVRNGNLEYILSGLRVFRVVHDTTVSVSIRASRELLMEWVFFSVRLDYIVHSSKRLSNYLRAIDICRRGTSKVLGSQGTCKAEPGARPRDHAVTSLWRRSSRFEDVHAGQQEIDWRR